MILQYERHLFWEIFKVIFASPMYRGSYYPPGGNLTQIWETLDITLLTS